MAVVNCTVAMSIIAHGMSAVPLSKIYAKRVEAREGAV
jgi:hypothetical protein